MNKNLLSAVLSGLLLGLPFCLPQFFFAIFFAWIPLLWIEETHRGHPNSYILFNYSFLSFFIWNSLSYWWVGQAHIFGVILIIVLNSLLLALIFWLVSKCRKQLKIPILFPFLIIWLGFEYFHTWWDLAWPWLNLGNSFATVPKWVQWYQFTGTRGGSLWIILVNLSLFSLLKKTRKDLPARSLGLITLIGLPLLFSVVPYQQGEVVTGHKSFALIQPNLDPYTEKFIAKNEKKHFTDFLLTADSVCRQYQPDYLFGPETIILEPINEVAPKTSPHYLQLTDFKRKHPNTNLIIGTHSNKIFDDKKHESYNSAMFLADTINPVFYHKTRLVPLFERMPFSQYLGFLKDFSLEIGGYHGTYNHQNTIAYFKQKDSLAIIPIVCFESIFSDYCAKRTPNMPGFICMLTNDGWWKNTPGYQHHFNFSRLRAIENGRHFIRVANNGISAHINSKGEILAKTNWWENTILTGNLSLINKKTFYSEHGDFIGRICAFFATLLLIFVKIRSNIANSVR